MVLLEAMQTSSKVDVNAPKPANWVTEFHEVADSALNSIASVLRWLHNARDTRCRQHY